MKKRLLSAALALAMVLTLLPVSAFAADPVVGSGKNPASGTTTVTYYEANTITSNNTAGWYFQETVDGVTTYYPVNTGVINGLGNSGTWYDVPWNNVDSWRTKSFTLVAPSFSMIDRVTTSTLTINLHGNTLNCSSGLTVGPNFTSLTIQDTTNPTTGGPNGTVTLPTGGLVTDHSFTLNATNVNINGAINLTSAASGTSGVTHSVTLDNSTVSDAVTLDGTVSGKTSAQQTLTLNNASSITGAVNVSGERSTITLNANTLSMGSSLGDEVNLTGESTTITLNTGASVGGTSKKDLKVTGKSSQVVVNGGNITGGTALDGAGASMRVSGAGNTGAIVLKVTDGKKTDTAPSLSHTGTGTIGPIYANQMGAVEDSNVISITGKGHVAGKSNFSNANITVTDSHIAEIEAFEKGTLTVSGTNTVSQSATIGTIAGIGHATDRTGKVDIKVSGYNVLFTGNIQAVNGNANPINLDLSGDTNKYLGTTNPVPNDNMRAGGTVSITGGTFGASIKEAKDDGTGYTKYLPSSLLFEIVEKTPKTYTYVDTIQKAQQIQGGDTTKYTVGWRDGYETTGQNYTLTFKIGGKTELVITADKGKVLPLPTSLSGRNNIKTWTNSTNPDDTYTAGKTYTMGGANLELEALDVELGITEITDITVLSPEGVTASLNRSSKSIALGGVVDFTSAQVDVVLKVKTSNAKETEVTVTYTKALNTTVFSSVGNPDNGLAIKGSGELEVPGGTRYTATSNFSELNKALKVGGMTGSNATAVHATINVSGWNNEQKTITKNALEGYNGNSAPTATADFSGSNAIWGAVNKVMASTNSRVSSLLTTANTNYCKQILNIANPTATQVQNRGPFTTIWIYAYLDVRVKTINDGLMTADLVPSYKLIAGTSTPPTLAQLAALERVTTTLKVTSDCALVQDLTSLGNLTGTAGTVKFKLGNWTPYAAPQNANMTAHQDNKYAYEAATTGSAGEFTVTHISTSNGLGSFVINGTKPLVELQRWNSAASPQAAYEAVDSYDDLESAANDTKYVADKEHPDVVQVSSGYTGPTAISLSGERRTFTIKTASGVKPVSITNTALDGWKLDNNSTNTEYTVQVLKDTVKPTTPTQKPIAISVASVTGGSASLSASRADEGDTITVTLTPAANYRVGGVTVTAAVKNSTTGVTTNTTVSTTAASANSWRFVVPTGATSVTVTPSFVKVNTNATVTVSNPAVGGTAVTSAGNSQVAPGTPVSVTVSPATGYRTMGIYVTNATATRTGANTFSFIVPSGVTNVVVTPRFDRNNGTLFEDVWSTDYFSNAVGWAVGRGITNGDGSVYRFGTGKSCTREDMVTFLWRNAGSPIVTGVSNPFWDVQVGSYYYNAVMWAVKNGITKGVSANQFGVGRAVTRGEAVTFLYRAAGEPAASTNSGFYDVPSGEYYAKAVSWAVGKGITNGDGSTVKFSPNGYCLREQIVTFMYRNATGTRA